MEQVQSPARAPLIANLRDQSVEFLNRGYLERLRILFPSTCVSFGTGTFDLPRCFSWNPLRQLRLKASTSLLGTDAADFPTAALKLVRGRLAPRLSSRIRHTIGQMIAGSTGMLTSCPSTTPFGLALGPD